MEKYRFPRNLWFTLFTGFIAQACYFMMWPFLSLLLYQKQDFGMTEIGFMLGGSTAVVLSMGFVSGYLSDRYGRIWLVRSGLAFMSIGMWWMMVSSTDWEYVASLGLFSIGRGLFQVPFRALLSDLIRSSEERDKVLNLNYFLANVGASLGAGAGMMFGFEGMTGVLGISGGIYALMLAMTLTVKLEVKESGKKPPRKRYLDIIRSISSNKLFVLVLAGNIVIMFIIDQVDTSLMQYLSRLDIDNVQRLLSSVIVINSVSVMVLHLPISHMMVKFNLSGRMYIGLLILLFSQVVFFFCNEKFISGWLIATMILTIGEIIVFPTSSIIIDKLAPASEKGNYFAISSLSSVGWILAPIVGGLIMDNISFAALCVFCAMLCSVLVYLYRYKLFTHSGLNS